MILLKLEPVSWVTSASAVGVNTKIWASKNKIMKPYKTTTLAMIGSLQQTVSEYVFNEKVLAILFTLNAVF